MHLQTVTYRAQWMALRRYPSKKCIQGVVQLSPVINKVYFKLGFKISFRLKILDVFTIVVVVNWFGEGLTWKGIAIVFK